MDRIQIDTNRLREETEKLDQCRVDLSAQVKRLYDDVAQLNTMWTGKANAAFNAQFHLDQQTLEEICQALQKFAGDLNTAAVEYDRCDQEIGELVASVQI